MKINTSLNNCRFFILLVFLGVFTTNDSIAGSISDIDTVVLMTFQDNYSPDQISVVAGTTVRWVGMDIDSHTVTSDPANANPGGPDSAEQFPDGVSAGQSYSWTVPASAAPGTTWYFHCRFHGQEGNGQAPGSGMTGSITVESAGLPEIKANGQDGPLVASSSTSIPINLSLSGVNQAINADWWIVASTPSGFYSWVSPNGWTPGFISTGQFLLFNVSNFEIFNGSLPAGDYIFYFGVDLNPNGVADSPLLYDSIQVQITD